MKLTDTTPRVINEVITEVRAIKRAISDRRGNDIGRLLEALIAQKRSAGILKAESGRPEVLTPAPTPLAIRERLWAKK